VIFPITEEKNTKYNFKKNQINNEQKNY